MNLDIIMVYCVVAFFYVISPGPAVLLAISNGMTKGMKVVSISSFANILGLFILSGISMLGLGTLLLTSASLFLFVKVVGAFYLIYLGVKQLKNGKMTLLSDVGLDMHRKRYRSVFKESFFLAVTNPKPILFFTALFPQFLDLKTDMTLQFFILTGIFMFFSFFTLCAYGLISKGAKKWLGNPQRMAWFHRISGGLFIAMGIGLLQLKKASN